MTADPTAPARYGAGLAVLVVGTGAEPFGDAVPPAAATAAPVLLVDSGTPGGASRGAGPVLRLSEDVGRAAAVNRAVVTLPPDVGLVAVAPPGLTWAPGALDALHAAAQRYPRAGILAPRVCAPGGAVVPSTHALPRRGRRPAPVAQDVEGPVGWSSAPALLLRRTALDSVDGFDPRYPGRLDDLDLADRLATAGWLTVHVPAATVVYASPPRPDPAAARRYRADRTPWRTGAP